MRQKLDRERQKAVILHALHAPDAEGRIGRTRLWLRSFLFLLDLEAYRTLGASITGARYRRGVQAPIVEGLSRSIAELEAEGQIAKGSA